MNKNKEDGMSKAMAAVPLPTKKRVEKLVQAEVDAELVDAVSELRAREGLHLKSIIEWGLKMWVAEKDPARARALGILK